MLMLAALTLAVAAPPPSSSPAAAPGPVAALDACRAVAEDVARLACFDRTAAALADARTKREVVVMDRAEVGKTKRGLFGFTLPSLNLFGGDDDAVREIKGSIASVADAGLGYFVLALDDGSAWQTSDRIATFNPRRGDSITVKRGAFGFRAVTRNTQVAVRRVR